jgi:hypothetical protein
VVFVLTDGVSHLVQFCTVALATLQFYDYSLTLPDEVSFGWSFSEGRIPTERTGPIRLGGSRLGCVPSKSPLRVPMLITVTVFFLFLFVR